MPRITSLDNITPITVAHNGRFHPGLQYGIKIWYWPNDLFATEEAAKECARGMIEQTIRELNESLGTSMMKSLT